MSLGLNRANLLQQRLAQWLLEDLRQVSRLSFLHPWVQRLGLIFRSTDIILLFLNYKDANQLAMEVSGAKIKEPVWKMKFKSNKVIIYQICQGLMNSNKK